MDLQTLKLSDVVESDTNPRKDFNKLELTNLAEDIKARGLLQPILVRKKGKAYVVVAGARRYRAHVLAELPDIKALVVELADLEAEEAQLVENDDTKRIPLKPLEKAEGYAGLMKRHGLSADEVAQRLKVSRSNVYATIRLNKLHPDGKKALKDGVIKESLAKLLAQVHSARQAEAVKDVLGLYSRVMTYREAAHHLQTKFFLDLRSALFDVKDAELDHEAGPCTSCEKRTGAQPELPLGEDVALEPDLCTDAPCWAEKTKRTAAAQAVKRGLELLGDKEVAKLFNVHGDLVGTEYVQANRPHPGSSTGQTYDELLTPEAKKKQLVMAVDPRGVIVELVRNDGLKAAIDAGGRLKLRKAKPESKSNSSSSKKSSAGLTPEQKAKEAAAAEKARLDASIQEKLAPALVAALVAAVEKRGLDKKMLALVARQAISNTEYVLERRKLKGSPWQLDSAQKFDKLFGKLTPAQLVGLIFESVYDQDFCDAVDGGGDVAMLEPLAEELGVDVKKLEASIRAATEDFGGRSCLLPNNHAENLLHDGRPGANKAPAGIPTKAKAKPAKKAAKKKAA